MKTSRHPSLGTMKRLMEEIKKFLTKPEGSAIQIEVRSYDKPHFALYFPGIDDYSWKYFESWGELVAFCLDLIESKRREQNEDQSRNR